MSSVMPANSRPRRIAKLFAAFGLVTLAAACSSSTSRFGPFEQTAGINPGSSYPSGPSSKSAGAPAPLYTASVDRRKQEPAARPFYTASVNPRKSDRRAYSRSVTSAPLDDAAQAPDPAPSVAPLGYVTVQPGDTVYGISRRNGVDMADLASINGLSSPYAIKLGQKLRIPRNGVGRTGSLSPQPAPVRRVATVPVRKTGARMHRVQPGETLYSLSRKYGVKPMAIAEQNAMSAPYMLKTGQNIRISGGNRTVAKLSPAAPKVPSYRSPSTQIKPARATPSRPVAVAAPPLKPAAAAPTPKRSQKTAFRGPLPKPDPRSSSKFRWPVKGKIISRFGPRANGVRNEGINIAVPEGTSVRAAENGVVAYAGSELKGYGNLILVRHTDNWVTAYAHNGRMFVRRGEKVTRGQIIAKAGKTGSVTRPQLHFEIRKGSKAVDPLKYMNATYFAGG